MTQILIHTNFTVLDLTDWDQGSLISESSHFPPLIERNFEYSKRFRRRFYLERLIFIPIERYSWFLEKNCIKRDFDETVQRRTPNRRPVSIRPLFLYFPKKKERTNVKLLKSFKYLNTLVVLIDQNLVKLTGCLKGVQDKRQLRTSLGVGTRWCRNTKIFKRKGQVYLPVKYIYF